MGSTSVLLEFVLCYATFQTERETQEQKDKKIGKNPERLQRTGAHARRS